VSTPKGGIRGEVVVVNSFEDLEKIKSSVRGKIVVYNVPFTNYSETVKYRYDGPNIAAKYGAIASLVRSVGNGLMDNPHTGTMGQYKAFKKIPHAAITAEDAMMIDRICKRGQRVVLKLKMEAKFVEDRWSRNVLAELRGSTYPEEIVIVGGHIDSWDVGQGAPDDAGGCIAAWRAVTLIKELGLKPRRTIRIVLWTNEENGGKGNINYKNEHFNELDNHILAIESDGGVFAPQGFGFTGSARAKKIVLDISDLLEPIRANTITDLGRGADIAPLNDEGVPVMLLNVDISKYFWYHHSNVSAFEWWYQKYLLISTFNNITGTPSSFNGAISAPLPQSVIVFALIGSKRSDISKTIFFARALPVKPKPWGAKTPPSDSIAKI
jgi:carboxypeptidase Q